MAAAFFPLVIAWFLLAPFLGLFEKETTSDPGQLWRPILAMIFAGPLAAVLRGFWLGAAIIPIFAVVLASTSACGMLLWRGLYYFLGRTMQK
jgi:ABC-type xylose transport system permease subunit